MSRAPPIPPALDDQAWAEFLYFRDNPRGLIAERWRHVAGCGRFFNCVRDTVSDRILATYHGRRAEARLRGAAKESAK